MILDKLQTSANLGHVNRFWPGWVYCVMKFFRKLFRKRDIEYEPDRNVIIKLLFIVQYHNGYEFIGDGMFFKKYTILLIIVFTIHVTSWQFPSAKNLLKCFPFNFPLLFPLKMPVGIDDGKFSWLK
jgi:hypothetical protein